jgi:hypothetical protein
VVRWVLGVPEAGSSGWGSLERAKRSLPRMYICLPVPGTMARLLQGSTIMKKKDATCKKGPYDFTNDLYLS